MPDISVTRSIAASPEAVFALVSDVTRMGEWSPEATGGQWVKGATGPAVGARFQGTNARGEKEWSTTCTVTACEPGRAFGFNVRGGPLKVAQWDFTFEDAGDGTTKATETWNDERGVLLKSWLGAKLTGVTDRENHNRSTMEQTLQGLANAAEK